MLKQNRSLKDLDAGKNIFIGEDFSKRVRDTRRKLIPFLKEAKKDKNKRATMVFDHLVIDGKRLFFDPVKNCLTENKK